MRTIFHIAKNELRTLFYSPIAWLLLVIFSVQVGMNFTDTYIGLILRGVVPDDITAELFIGQFGFFNKIPGILYLYVPLLLMGIISNEFNNGTIKLLYSSPITNFQIVSGKYLSLLMYAVILLLFCLGLIVLFCAVTIVHVDLSLIFSGLLAFFLLLAVYMSIGLFMSSLTSYQIIAALGTLAMLAFLNYVGNIGQGIAWVRDVTYWLNLSGRTETMIGGLICSEDVLYFFIVSALFISLSVIRFNILRMRVSVIKRLYKYSYPIIIAVILGYITSLPICKFYYDATFTKFRTLTTYSQDIVKQLEGKDIKITTYANLFSNNAEIAFPKNLKRDFSRFEQYIRYKPDIDMNYVYYYHPSQNSSNWKFANFKDEDRAEKITTASKLKLNEFLTPEQIREKIDLSGEDYRFTRTIEDEQGNGSRLRLYSDQMLHPGETEITTALKTLIVKSPNVRFLTGHDERGIDDSSNLGYNYFTRQIYNRVALINQGFNVNSLSLKEGDRIPDDVDILVIADPRLAFSDWELEEINRYIASGRNLLITTKPYRYQYVNPLVNPLGVKFMNGFLVQEKPDFSPELLFVNYGENAGQISTIFAQNALKNIKVSAPGSVGLGYEESEFKITPILITDSELTDSTNCWNEVETLDFEKEKPVMNPEVGEYPLKSVPIALALQRNISNRDQRIIILGNADCLNNPEITRRRHNVNTANFSFVTGAFRWFSYGEYPIELSRKEARDNGLRYVEYKDDRKWIVNVFVYIIPAIFLITGVISQLRRKRK